MTTSNSHTYLGVEINDTWPTAKLAPDATLSTDDRAERYEAFIGDERPYRRVAAGSLAEVRRLIKQATSEASDA